MAGLPCITRLLTGRVATFQTLLFARTLPVVFLHWLFIELEITIVRALILQSENPMNTIPNTLRTVQKQNRAQPHGKNWSGYLKRDLPLTKTLLHKAAVTYVVCVIFVGCFKNSELETSDLRPRKLRPRNFRPRNFRPRKLRPRLQRLLRRLTCKKSVRFLTSRWA